MSWLVYLSMGLGAGALLISLDVWVRRRHRRRRPIVRQVSADTQKLGEFVRERMEKQSS